MYLLIRYKGEIKVNQVGMNYDFPHYSTVLGAVLSVYHKHMNSPRHPRQDMYDLAARLNISLSLAISENNSNKLLLEYAQYRNMEKKIKDPEKDPPYSPTFRHLIKGEFYILIHTDNQDVMSSLLRYPIKLGSNDGAMVDYEVEIFDSLDVFIDKYEQKVYVLKDNRNYTFDANYPQGKIEVCLVSQIEKPGKKVFGQGVYSEVDFDLLDKMFGVEMISYRSLKELVNDELMDYIDKINEAVKEVLK